MLRAHFRHVASLARLVALQITSQLFCNLQSQHRSSVSQQRQLTFGDPLVVVGEQIDDLHDDNDLELTKSPLRLRLRSLDLRGGGDHRVQQLRRHPWVNRDKVSKLSRHLSGGSKPEITSNESLSTFPITSSWTSKFEHRLQNKNVNK